MRFLFPCVNRPEWLKNHIAQLALVTTQQQWSLMTEKALRTLGSGGVPSALKSYYEFQLEMLEGGGSHLRAEPSGGVPNVGDGSGRFAVVRWVPNKHRGSSMRIVGILAHGALSLALVASQAEAVPIFGSVGSIVVEQQTGGTVTEISPLTVVQTANGFQLSGDLEWDLSATTGAQALEYSIALPFSVGPLPESGTLDVTFDYKVVNAAFSTLGVTALAEVVEVGSGLGTGFSEVLNNSSSLVASQSFRVRSGTGSDGGVLGSGNYLLELSLLATFVSPASPSLDLIYIEMGGLSGFGGLEVSLETVAVPEPGSALLVGAGLVVLRRRSAAVAGRC